MLYEYYCGDGSEIQNYVNLYFSCSSHTERSFDNLIEILDYLNQGIILKGNKSI